ncbi:hypothetical protein M501DRAFT_933373 [Patellaria atrata CBS 101060]|uniref:STB6-like N-terminal domain-containing protein n=1 Tax=Patellaria atrata CBS 101060 TaxID=1346257 RepID=A0A9P4SB70_9PEZI|nr:hypothetical protein M501DRAFT_933373 [Patellaria atrata CBS 101060]
MATPSRFVPTDADLRRRLPQIKTSQLYNTNLGRSSASVNSTRKSTSPKRSSLGGPKQSHQRFVLTDPVAFKYLEEDPSVKVLARREKLEGFECYIVEQWACSRTHPTFVITTYSGDPTHSVAVNVFSVSTDEREWSPRLSVYFKALNQYHARPRETHLGILMVTNLSAFPSSLTVIPVPEGDVRKHREDFFVNENLKRLGCSGRVALTLTTPNSATQAKFHQLYKISDKIPLYSAVIELVKLCQAALMLFDKLEPEYADGLLCDVTEKAINDWWVEFGTEWFMIEPHDGILGPTTVAALLGMLMGARNRLHAYSAPVAKDVFDIESTKRGIAYFQKSQRIKKTRRLDRLTLERIHKATAKAASSEGWKMPHAVKSTVAELSGKGGEMVMDMVGARDKVGIAEIETTDIERFAQLVQGEKAKWLWHAKPRKTNSGDMFNRLPGSEGLVFQKDDQGGYAWGTQRKDSTNVDIQKLRKESVTYERYSPEEQPLIDSTDKDQSSKKTLLKRATGKMTDARSGLGRIKDAVGRREHGTNKSSRDENGYPGHSDAENGLRRTETENSDRLVTTKDTKNAVKRPPTRERDDVTSSPTFTKVYSETPHESKIAFFPDHVAPSTNDEQPELGAVVPPDDEPEYNIPTADPSIAGSVYQGVDLEEIFQEHDGPEKHVGLLLRRTKSFSRYRSLRTTARNDQWWPRHLSFSIAEESILTWKNIVPASESESSLPTDPKKALVNEIVAAELAKQTRDRIVLIQDTLRTWVDSQLSRVKDLENLADQDNETLEQVYQPRLETFRTLSADVQEILEEEKTHLQESITDVENVTAKLEYEVSALRGKVEDVEDSVEEFEKRIEFVERKLKDYEDETKEKEGWLHWILRMATGLGRAPQT